MEQPDDVAKEDTVHSQKVSGSQWLSVIFLAQTTLFASNKAQVNDPAAFGCGFCPTITFKLLHTRDGIFWKHAFSAITYV
jgi:hypothetical protein